MAPVSVKRVVTCAVDACRIFADFAPNFFTAHRGGNWLGWENWLTVETLRRINSDDAVPFAAYSDEQRKFDLYLRSSRTGVEVKTTYISDEDIKSWSAVGERRLTDRLRRDARKLAEESAKSQRNGLLLLAAIFESRSSYAQYQKLVAKDLSTTYAAFPKQRWFDCSTSISTIGLLALSSTHPLPTSQPKGVA